MAESNSLSPGDKRKREAERAVLQYMLDALSENILEHTRPEIQAGVRSDITGGAALRAVERLTERGIIETRERGRGPEHFLAALVQVINEPAVNDRIVKKLSESLEGQLVFK